MLTALVLAALATAPQQDAVELVWNPAQGSELERRVDFEISGGLDDSRGWLDAFGLGGLADVRVVGRLHVYDTLVRVEAGRPLELERELLGLSTRWDAFERREVATDLVGSTLRYTWDPEARAFECWWSSPAPRALARPALREDLDLRALLPDRPVRVGELWHVPVSAVAPLLLPAGALHVDPELGRAWGFDGLANAFDVERMQRIRDGTVECLLARVEGDLAVVELGWSWWGTLDPFLTIESDSRFAPHVRSSTPLDLDARAWGRLTWDLAAGHARELELEAELEGHLGGPSGWPLRVRGMWWYAIESR